MFTTHHEVNTDDHLGRNRRGVCRIQLRAREGDHIVGPAEPAAAPAELPPSPPLLTSGPPAAGKPRGPRLRRRAPGRRPLFVSPLSCCPCRRSAARAVTAARAAPAGGAVRARSARPGRLRLSAPAAPAPRSAPSPLRLKQTGAHRRRRSLGSAGIAPLTCTPCATASLRRAWRQLSPAPGSIA
jgi:hypothetical protein